MSYPHPTPYERLGGEQAIAEFVDAFYERVLADPDLRGFFEHADMARLREMQRELFAVALGGPVRTTGSPLAYAHRGRGIERRHFARFVEHLLAVLAERGLDERDVHDLLDRVDTMSSDVIGGHGTSG